MGSDFIDDVAEGDVVVIDNDGRTDCTVWGDIMTQYAGSQRIAATVIDGVCRDVSKALDDGYPLFTKGRVEVAACARSIEAVEARIRGLLEEGKSLRAVLGYHTLQRKG